MVFGKDDFVAWANENIVLAVGHNGATHGEDHKPVDQTDPKTKETHSVCPKYFGLTCEEHQKVHGDAHNPPEGLPKIPEAKGVPNTWIVNPAGEVTEIEGADKDNPKAITDKVTAMLKTASPKPVPYKKWQEYVKAFADADKAVEDGKLRDALAILVKVDADAKKLTKGLADKWKAKVDAVNAKAAAKFEEAKAGSLDAAAKAKAVKALRADVGTKVSTGSLPVVADLDAWLKDPANAAPAPAK